MFKLYNGLYGNPDLCTTFSRVGSDNESTYMTNLKTQSKDWLYRTKEVNYQRNSHGHRCGDATNCKIVFAGCSITEGISVALEDTFAYKVSTTLGLKYYNLGINGFGPDMLSINLSKWIELYGAPDIVVLQWPQAHRKFELVNEEAVPVGPWHDRTTSQPYISKDMWNNYEKVITTNYMDHFYFIIRETTVSYLKSLGIKVAELFPEDIPLIDRGRDLTHPGIKSHQILTDKLLQLL